MEPETAKALAETAKAIPSVAGLAEKAGGYMAQVLGDLPQNLVGLLGDWVSEKRLRNLAAMKVKTDLHLATIDSSRLHEPSPTLLLPLLEAAAEEGRDELQNLWAALLANAWIDDGRRLRRDFFEVIKRLEPEDAMILNMINSLPPQYQVQNDANYVARHQAFEDIAVAGRISAVRVRISLAALASLGCIQGQHDPAVISLTDFGAGLMEACTVS